MIRRFRVPFRHQLITAALLDRLRHHGFGVVNVPEQSCGGRTREHACRLSISLGEVFVMDPIHAQGALRHLLALFVQFACAVRTRPRAVLAANAFIEVHQHKSVFLAFIARTGWTHGHARRVLAVQARLRKVDGVGERILARFKGLYTVEERAGRIGVVGPEIGQTAGLARRVPFLAARHAGVASHADVQIDYERHLGHWMLLVISVCWRRSGAQQFAAQPQGRASSLRCQA